MRLTKRLKSWRRKSTITTHRKSRWVRVFLLSGECRSLTERRRDRLGFRTGRERDDGETDTSSDRSERLRYGKAYSDVRRSTAFDRRIIYLARIAASVALGVNTPARSLGPLASKRSLSIASLPSSLPTACRLPIGALPISLLQSFGRWTPYSVFDRQEPSSEVYSKDSLPRLRKRIDELSSVVRDGLRRQGFADERIKTETYLNLRCARLIRL